jgi:hypothetical protein
MSSTTEVMGERGGERGAPAPAGEAVVSVLDLLRRVVGAPTGGYVGPIRCRWLMAYPGRTSRVGDPER